MEAIIEITVDEVLPPLEEVERVVAVVIGTAPDPRRMGPLLPVLWRDWPLPAKWACVKRVRNSRPAPAAPSSGTSASPAVLDILLARAGDWQEAVEVCDERVARTTAALTNLRVVRIDVLPPVASAAASGPGMASTSADGPPLEPWPVTVHNNSAATTGGSGSSKKPSPSAGAAFGGTGTSASSSSAAASSSSASSAVAASETVQQQPAWLRYVHTGMQAAHAAAALARGRWGGVAECSGCVIALPVALATGGALAADVSSAATTGSTASGDAAEPPLAAFPRPLPPSLQLLHMQQHHPQQWAGTLHLAPPPITTSHADAAASSASAPAAVAPAALAPAAGGHGDTTTTALVPVPVPFVIRAVAAQPRGPAFPPADAASGDHHLCYGGGGGRYHHPLHTSVMCALEQVAAADRAREQARGDASAADAGGAAHAPGVDDNSSVDAATTTGTGTSGGRGKDAGAASTTGEAATWTAGAKRPYACLAASAADASPLPSIAGAGVCGRAPAAPPVVPGHAEHCRDCCVRCRDAALSLSSALASPVAWPDGVSGDNACATLLAAATAPGALQQRVPSDSYLATGHDAFLTHEPDAMDAMALVHARVARVFYALPDASEGVLGSLAHLHALPSMNHRYRVFKVATAAGSTAAEAGSSGDCAALAS